LTQLQNQPLTFLSSFFLSAGLPAGFPFADPSPVGVGSRPDSANRVRDHLILGVLQVIAPIYVFSIATLTSVTYELLVMGACFAGASPALQHAWRQLSIANNEHCKQRASVEHWTSIANNEHWTSIGRALQTMSIGRALQTTRIGRALDEHCKQRELDEHWTSIANNEQVLAGLLSNS
jgi:hypothetical protein